MSAGDQAVPVEVAKRGELGTIGASQARLNGAGIRSIALAVPAFLILFPLQVLCVAIAPRHYTVCARLFHRVMCRAFGVKRTLVGQRTERRPVLFVSNHISWLDIPVLGSVVPGSYVAKAEIADWGLFGTLAKLQRTIFVTRERRTASAKQRNAIVDHLAENQNVILFPEGTSSAGNGVLPFKSALFSVIEAAQDAGLEPIIQPISLAYTDVNNIPLVRANRHAISWVGDMEFLPHVIQVMCLSRIDATIHFHEPVRLEEFDDRKSLAQHCEQVVGQGVRLANSGRLAETLQLAQSSDLP